MGHMDTRHGSVKQAPAPPRKTREVKGVGRHKRPRGNAKFEPWKKS